MLFHNIVGSILYRIVTFTVITSMLGSSIPIIRELPKATAAYLGMMNQLGLIKPDPTSPAGFRSTVPAGMAVSFSPRNSPSPSMTRMLSCPSVS